MFLHLSVSLFTGEVERVSIKLPLLPPPPVFSSRRNVTPWSVRLLRSCRRTVISMYIILQRYEYARTKYAFKSLCNLQVRGSLPSSPLNDSSNMQWLRFRVWRRRNWTIFCGTALIAVYDRSRCCRLRSLNICSGIPPQSSHSAK